VPDSQKRQMVFMPQTDTFSVAAWMCIVTSYCLAVWLANCSKLPVHCIMRNYA